MQEVATPIYIPYQMSPDQEWWWEYTTSDTPDWMYRFERDGDQCRISMYRHKYHLNRPIEAPHLRLIRTILKPMEIVRKLFWFMRL